MKKFKITNKQTEKKPYRIIVLFGPEINYYRQIYVLMYVGESHEIGKTVFFVIYNIL